MDTDQLALLVSAVDAGRHRVARALRFPEVEVTTARGILVSPCQFRWTLHTTVRETAGMMDASSLDDLRIGVVATCLVTTRRRSSDHRE